VLGKMGPGKAFGELAILYNCTRTASIRGEVQPADRHVPHFMTNLYEYVRVENNAIAFQCKCI
jgi:hypothetical protein